MIGSHGYQTYPVTPEGRAWADVANRQSDSLTANPAIRAANLRHQDTWFVGVDVLPTDNNGALSGIDCDGAWTHDIPDVKPWHKAQLSVVYPGYPQRDPDQSAANHAFRVNRCAAHVDGLLPFGPLRKRYAREFHAFVLGLPLNHSKGAPTVCWSGSQKIMGAALRDAIGQKDPREVDVTDVYQDARRLVFDTCDMVELQTTPGAAFLLHRFTLHGTAPWRGSETTERRIAFFRPEFAHYTDWLAQDW